ncbi:unnamed protein product [Pylaiella littoralis]
MCTTRTPPQPHTEKPLFKLKTAAKHSTTAAKHSTRKSRPHTDMSLMDLPERTGVDEAHSQSNSSAVDVEGGDACMQSSPAEDQRQEQQQQQGEGASGRMK